MTSDEMSMKRTSAPAPARMIWSRRICWEASPSPGSPTTRNAKSPPRSGGSTLSAPAESTTGGAASTARVIARRQVSARRLLPRQTLAEAEQIGMIRQIEIPDHLGAVARLDGRRDHVPTHADDPERAGDGDGPRGRVLPQHQEKDRHCHVADDPERERQGRVTVPASPELDG